VKIALVVLASTSFTLFSCQDRMAEQSINSLADRFDAPSCFNARLLSAGGRELENAREAFRNFAADDDCLTEVVAGATEIGFEHDTKSALVYHDSFGITEKIEIGPSETGQGFRIVWTEWGFEQ